MTSFFKSYITALISIGFVSLDGVSATLDDVVAPYIGPSSSAPTVYPDAYYKERTKCLDEIYAVFDANLEPVDHAKIAVLHLTINDKFTEYAGKYYESFQNCLKEDSSLEIFNFCTNYEHNETCQNDIINILKYKDSIQKTYNQYVIDYFFQIHEKINLNLNTSSSESVEKYFLKPNDFCHNIIKPYFDEINK